MIEYIDTYYARTAAETGERPHLDGALQTEVCVIGGGLAGIATALELAEHGRGVVLLERNRVSWGASGRSGGFVAQGYHVGGPALIAHFGKDDARTLFDLSRVGQRLVRDRIARYAIACGPIVEGALTCALNAMPADLRGYRDVMHASFDVDLEYWPRARLREALATDRYDDALLNRDTFAVDPLALTRGLARAVEARGGRIFEASPAVGHARAGARHKVKTPSGEVIADTLVFACGGYIANAYRPLSNATAPVSSYAMVTPPLGEALDRAIAVPYAISDLQFLPNYYRKLVDGRLLWGGRAAGWEPTPRRAARLLEGDLHRMYPGLAQARAEVAWSGLMSYLTHEMPAIGRRHDGIWHATGFGGLGMAATTMAGHLIGTAIADGDDRWRHFARFGLPYAGGGWIARMASQLTIWQAVVAERLGRPVAVS